MGNNERVEANFNLSYPASNCVAESGSRRLSQEEKVFFFGFLTELLASEKKVYNVREVLGGESKKGTREIPCQAG
jgi:hypothetical protein